MSEVKKRGPTNTAAEEDEKTDTDPGDEFHAVITTTSKKTYFISRGIVIAFLLIAMYFSSRDNTERNMKPLAKQSESLPGKGQIVECSPSYLQEIDRFEGCFPRECKRFVTDMIVTVKEADGLLAVAEKGLKLGGSSGGRSVFDLDSGTLSLGQDYVSIYAQENARNLFTEADFNLYKVVKNKIKDAVGHHFGVDPNKLYLTHPTFFSRITAQPAVTIHDEYWHPHADTEIYESFHYSTLLYLNDYNIDFKGGRFVFMDENFNITVEPRKGRVNMFTSGGENLHYLEKVSSGHRHALTISFTCNIRFAIEDPSTKNYL